MPGFTNTGQMVRGVGARQFEVPIPFYLFNRGTKNPRAADAFNKLPVRVIDGRRSI
ncbi:MAG TPA: hypothetical protein VHC44_00480 [Verrucomicrobiae bacterium]|nr:hypothetical protein [Verrucomicrobiae bacterium]